MAEMYLQVKQAAALLDVSRQSIHAWIMKGHLGTALVAGRRFVLQDDRFKAIKQRRKNGK